MTSTILAANSYDKERTPRNNINEKNSDLQAALVFYLISSIVM